MKTKPLVESTIERLIDYIIKNDLEPLQKLPTELELASLLSVGRSTVREAVKALVGRNILEVRQGAGTFMARQRLGVSTDPLGLTFVKNKRKLIKDLLEVRMMIEPRIAALAALAATQEDITVIHALRKEIEELISSGEDHTQKDIEFHMKIAESSNNIVLPTLTPAIQQAISLFVDVTNRTLRTETIETHRAISDAIEAHNPIAAHDAMTLHIVYNRTHIANLFKNTAFQEGDK
ncbi:MAG: FadR family transcriptional regulator [Treponema sp.]|jgi:DNA-binding FadR family transcriptional regulator|nr:FadR family transcriptional regulator [Treponema sp.]